MCGFCGFYTTQRVSGDFAHAGSILKSMTDRIENRGPDDEGQWLDAEVGLALGHRRLSILDLSPAGHQPMESASQRFVIIFNGEIYNFGEIRQQLEQENAAPAWRGHSDTEIILAAFEKWGGEESLKRMVGMFALALWDRAERKLYLARDRMGEKPLYYGWQNGTFLFGSELKALNVHPRWAGEISRDSLTSFMRHGYVPAPYSIYQDIYKLKPGCYLCLSVDDIAVGDEPEQKSYWSIDEAAVSGRNNPFSGTADEAVDELERLLKQSIRGQMIADVPLGAFLSGGIDSSTVVALMQKLSDRPVNTFSIGFNEKGYNEAEHAKAVAEHLGTNHTELYVTVDQARDVIPQLPALYDEPLADASQLPTFLVCSLAKQQVTVSLSGDGGDELFCGYSRYARGRQLWEKLSSLPVPLRKPMSKAIQITPAAVFDTLFSWMDGRLNGTEIVGDVSDKMQVLARVIGAENAQQVYQHITSVWKDPARVVIGGSEVPSLFQSADAVSQRFEGVPEDGFMFVDQHMYLPEDILVKVDRAAMGVSLEGRIPMLDHRIVEFAWRLPLEYKVRDGLAKWPLRQVLYRHVPRKLIDRPKMGFGVPIHEWLRRDIRDWAESLLDRSRLADEGFFAPELIHRMWDEHIGEKRDWQYTLWNVLVFQQWLENNKQESAARG